MTSSQMNATVVAGPAPKSPDGVELTLLLPLRQSSAVLRLVIERMSEALYAQCITFEILGLSIGAQDAPDDLDTLSRSRVVVADDADDAWAAGFSAARGRWVGFLECADGVDIDAYGFIEEVHRAREGSDPACAAA